ncbi:DNA polymerase III subunit gamma/tau [Alicyclobacillus mengziensis]|uniref:DNA-directed DNA polymerase n=1 Tax=Alicyclobacillus mengziensis TaxID=2931921 RepID=A0A9X7VZV0_9BACL|nr:DNA polymerase III subunit gamma/tau [Alicyclobacillus mengziensis]QSO47902.1 DNA polymerase III subunit gamma/tau [Alicyclobacillus mengziensis]
MSYQALYRAWRPQTFADLIGQPHVRQTLMNAIANGQVAHAYLFCGPRGTGKTSAAKVLAKAVNCLNPQGTEPCNECEACRSITNGSNVDVEEIDAASNRGVDEIRQLRDKVGYAPASVLKKVYIVDEVHMLTTEAFNALLKTLEEPPSHTLFVLATTEPHKIPATIISRCQRFDFRRIEPELITERLREICGTKGWQVDEEALWRIAQAADGGLRDALGLLEQTAAYGDGNITAETAAHVMGGVQTEDLLALVQDLASAKLKEVLRRLVEWYKSGKDATRILYEILQLMRDLFIVKLSGEVPLRFLQHYKETAEQLDGEWLLIAMQRLGELYVQLRYVDQPRIALETALLGLVPRFGSLQPNDALHDSPVPKSAMGAKAGSAASASTKPDTATTLTQPGTTTAPSREAVPPASDTAMSREPVATQAGLPLTGLKASSPETPTMPKKRTTARNTGSRKLEVLRQLSASSSPAFLGEITNAWQDVLNTVRNERITTHAWLINGEPVLATADTVVVAFTSRIHRDAVMKQDERSLIEQVLANQFGRDVQILALLQTDWQAYLDTTLDNGESASNNSAETTGNELAARAISLFGRDLVEIDTKE